MSVNHWYTHCWLASLKSSRRHHVSSYACLHLHLNYYINGPASWSWRLSVFLLQGVINGLLCSLRSIVRRSAGRTRKLRWNPFGCTCLWWGVFDEIVVALLTRFLVLKGALLMLYIQLTQVLLRKPKRGCTFWAIVTYSSLLFPLATLAIVGMFKFDERLYIDNRTFSGGPIAFRRVYMSDPFNMMWQFWSVATPSVKLCINGFVVPLFSLGLRIYWWYGCLKRFLRCVLLTRV